MGNGWGRTGDTSLGYIVDANARKAANVMDFVWRGLKDEAALRFFDDDLVEEGDEGIWSCDMHTHV